MHTSSAELSLLTPNAISCRCEKILQCGAGREISKAAVSVPFTVRASCRPECTALFELLGIWWCTNRPLVPPKSSQYHRYSLISYLPFPSKGSGERIDVSLLWFTYKIAVAYIVDSETVERLGNTSSKSD